MLGKSNYETDRAVRDNIILISRHSCKYLVEYVLYTFLTLYMRQFVNGALILTLVGPISSCKYIRVFSSMQYNNEPMALMPGIFNLVSGSQRVDLEHL